VAHHLVSFERGMRMLRRAANLAGFARHEFCREHARRAAESGQVELVVPRPCLFYGETGLGCLRARSVELDAFRAGIDGRRTDLSRLAELLLTQGEFARLGLQGVDARAKLGDLPRQRRRLL